MNIKVHVTGFWQDDWSMFLDIKRYGFGQASWKNQTFVPDDNNYDIAVIVTAPFNRNKTFPAHRTFKFLTEPPCFQMHTDMECIECPQYLPWSWWIKSHYYDNIGNKESFYSSKQELFSTVTSDKRFWDGHIKRTKFLLALDALIEDGLDIYGRRLYGGLLSCMKNYKNSLRDKFDGLVPYQYHFACENSFIPDYFTEKIADPLIAETLCFYDGCTNLEEYIDERAFIRIDVTQIESSIETVFKSIDNNEYEKRHPYLLTQKKRMLTELNPLNIIWAQLNGKDMTSYFKIYSGNFSV